MEKTIINKDEFLNKLHDLIEEQMTDREVTILHLATDLGLTPQSLRRLVKAFTGMKVKDYVQQLRLVRAKRLLTVRPYMPIADVAIQCGIEESTHFCRFFKEATGMTTSEYRRLKAKK